MFGTACVYIFLYYIFVILFELHIKQATVNYVFPAILSFIAGLIYLSPKFDRVVILRKRANIRIEVLAIILNAAFIISSVHLVIALCSDKATLNNFDEIHQYPDARFFRIKNFEIDTLYTGYSSEITTSRKHGTTSIDVYIVAPLKSSIGNTNVNIHTEWVLQYYYLNASRRDNTDSIFKIFINNSVKHFNKTSRYKNIDHFERLLHSAKAEHAAFAIKNVIATQNIQPYIILTRESEPTEFKTRRALFWMLASLLGGSLLVCLLLMLVRVNTNKKPQPEDSFPFKVRKYYKLFINSFKD